MRPPSVAWRRSREHYRTGRSAIFNADQKFFSKSPAAWAHVARGLFAYDRAMLWSVSVLLLVLLLSGAAIVAMVVLMMARILLMPPRMIGGDALWTLKRLTPRDLGLDY